MLNARVTLSSTRRVRRAEVTLRIRPPVRGIFYLGAWLWHLDAEGGLGCGTVDGSACFGHPAAVPPGPVGFRCIVDP